jgi:FKBP12-rapamycin complex-associated protein
MRRLSVELLKESPSHALRACASLASVYHPLARELFNAAFISCWTELYDQFQDELVRSLEIALVSPSIPPEILQIILNLAEFMERDDKTLPIDIKTLGAYAAKCHAYAKALHYKEMEFMTEPLPDTIEALISINNQLQNPDAAIGILTLVQTNNDLELKESWYEKLQRWDDAYEAYTKRHEEDPDNFNVTLGRMRCLNQLGEWQQLSQIAQEKWFSGDDSLRKTMAPLAAAAAWGLGQWELMDDYVSYMKADGHDSVFFKAILAIHRNQFSEAELFIDRSRDLLDTNLKALVGESYSRAYEEIVRVQMLAELEEIITYKKSQESDQRELIRKTWMKRIKGCQRNLDIWSKILKVRALVISPADDYEMWIKYANLCRKSGRMGLALKAFSELLENHNDLSGESPTVVYSYLKYLWANGNREGAFNTLKGYAANLASKITEDERPFLSKCYVKIAQWKSTIDDAIFKVW